MGNKNKSHKTALIKVTEIRMPTLTEEGLFENSMIKKPKNKTTVVKQMAFPVSTNVTLTASSVVIPADLANLNLLKK